MLAYPSKQEKKGHKLQTMSDFATIRFELKNSKVYSANPTAKRNPFSRFGKNKGRVQYTSASQAKLQQSRQNMIRIQEQGQANQDDGTTATDQMAFKLKFLQKLSNEHLLIGNQYQLDLLEVSTINNSFVNVECKWSICPSDLISSISIDAKYSVIAVSLGQHVEILKYNLKAQGEYPESILKNEHKELVKYVRFVRNMSMFVVLQTKIEFYSISIVYQKAEMSLCFTHSINYGPNMKLYHVPQAIDNTLILYFYQNKVKKQEVRKDSQDRRQKKPRKQERDQSKQELKFGLWMQLIEVKAGDQIPVVGKMILNYMIPVKERKEFSIFNYNKDICLIKSPFSITAVKNGFVIDDSKTNIQKKQTYIEYLEASKKVVHFRTTYIDIYQLSMDLNAKPCKIKLSCLDSVAFQEPKQETLFKIIELQPQCYAIFYQRPAKNLDKTPHLEYMLCISQESNLQSKIDTLYPQKGQIEEGALDILQDACSQAKKLGMNNKQAYYEMWKRSNQSGKIDYHILIATQDFTTIESQLQKKLKVKSMAIRDLINIYVQALDMLKLQVKGLKCTVKTLIEYSYCHFSLKKFKMLRYLKDQERLPQQSVVGDQKGQAILISIKDYYQYGEMSIFQQIISLTSIYLEKKSEDSIFKLKTILKHFKLLFRLNYMEIIEKIIVVCKLRLIQILEILPELLPCVIDEEKGGLGLWKDISEEEKEGNVFINDLMTIDNREVIKEFPVHLWFKRHVNSRHGVILIKKDQINKHLQQTTKSEDIFYRVLCRILDLNILNEKLNRLIFHIEENYELYPSHLRGKFALYFFLFVTFENFNQQYKLQDFFKIKQSELFKRYFEREKYQKNGFILKKIRPLYEKVVENGKKSFNDGLYNYFSSEQSTVGDLKCILNKLNNQKMQFHVLAESMYQVLITAIMKKIRIGGGRSDTPLQQILVYIENIPFPIHNDCIMTNLQYIQEINYEYETLKKIEVNMTLQQIVDNPKRVIEMMIEYQVNRHQIAKIKSYRSLKIYTYKILAEVQCRKSNIFGDQEHSYSFKVYLIKIMKTKEMINLCSQLLKDEYLISEYRVYKDFIEEIVIYLYHWKLQQPGSNKEIHYMQHIQYIQALIQILDSSNPKRKYIEYSIKYAELFTFEGGFKISYPLFSQKMMYPTLTDFVQTINCLSADELKEVNLTTVFELITNLKKLTEDELLQTEQLRIYSHKLKIELAEQLIIRLIEQNEFSGALLTIGELLHIPNEFPEYNIIFPCLLIERLLPELLQNTTNLLIRTISYYYYTPFKLTELLKYLSSQKFSNKEIDEYLESKIREQQRCIFGYKNSIINESVKEKAERDEKELGGINDDRAYETNKIFELCLQRLLRRNQIYLKNYSMHIMYRLLLHNPLAVSKWIFCKKTINAKTIRSFISFMALQLPFNHELTISQGKQIFEIVAFQYTHNIFFSEILRWKEKLRFEEMNSLSSLKQIAEEDRTLDIINDSIRLFQKKLAFLRTPEYQVMVSEFKKKEILDEVIMNPDDYMQKPVSQYIYEDRDDGYEQASDEIFIPRMKRQNTQYRIVSQSGLRSEDSDTTKIKVQQLLAVPKSSKARKYSQYFPQMLDIHEQMNEEVNQDYPQYTPKNMPYIDFKSAFNNVISEDNNENLPSMIQINCSDNLTKKVGFQSPNHSVESIQFQHEVSQYLQQSEKKGQKDPLKTPESSEIEFMHSEPFIEQPEEATFKINVFDKEKHLPAAELAQKMLSSVATKDGRFDLTLLGIEQRKENFIDYLSDIFAEIYGKQVVAFEKRMNLIILIAEEFQPEHISAQCIEIFRRLKQSSVIPKLSFKIAETIPIQMLLQKSFYDAFMLFKANILPRLDKINIFQAIELTEQLFMNPIYKDELLLSFIARKVKADSQRADQQKSKLIISALLNNLTDKYGSISKYSAELQLGSQEDKETAEILKGLELPPMSSKKL